MPNFELRFRISTDLEAELRRRDQEVDREGQWARKDSAGAIARRDLARYYHLIARELQALNLTEGEAGLICDANNGLGALTLGLEEDRMGGWIRSMLIQNVNDAVALNAWDKKWGLTENQATALLERMRRWTPGQFLAVADAVERFWAYPETTTVQSVGLVTPGRN